MHRNLTIVALALAGLFATTAAAGNIHYVEVNGDIQSVIDNASTGDTIQLAAGQYDITTTLDPGGKAVTILGTVDGDGDPTSILDGGNPVDGTSGVRVLICQSGETSATVFENLVIQNGYDSATSSGGAGMWNDSSSPTVTNCTFTDNTASGYGGGMYNYSNSNPTVTGCTFTNNTAGRSGAGMTNHDDSSPTLTNCTFTNNTASDDGGGMYNTNSSNPTVTNCPFTDNTASRYGGGMQNQDSSPTLINCTFTSNSGGDGGGMANVDAALPTLTGCTFTNNTASDDGGGMANSNYSGPILNDCTFSNNTASDDGGGMYNDQSEYMTLSNCTFTGNSANSEGGGMYNRYDGYDNPTLIDCNFCGNFDASGFNSISGQAIDGSSSGNTFIDASCADADKDGIPDVWDVCSNGDDTIDSDGDGTPDACDNCPGDPAKTEPGDCGCGVVDTTLAGDLDCDGDVDAADFALLRNQIGVANLGCVGSDINGDGTVDGADLAYILSFWGATCP
ncbi:MAG: hypothetical protein GWP75_10670 [Planctomycetia bacterium]|nr:hypothetical protein [Planctomycetia bacterium]